MSFLDVVKHLAPVAAGIAGSALTGSDVLGGAIAGGTSYALNKSPGEAILTGLGTGLGSSLFGASSWLNDGGVSPLGSLFGYSGSPLSSLFGTGASTATGSAGQRGISGGASGGGGPLSGLFGSGSGSSGSGNVLSGLGNWAASHPGVIAGGALGLLSGLSGYTKGTSPVKQAKPPKPGPLDSMNTDPNQVVHYIRIPTNQPPPNWDTYGQNSGEYSFFQNAPGATVPYYAKGGDVSNGGRGGVPTLPGSVGTVPWFRYGRAPDWSRDGGRLGPRSSIPGLTDRRGGGRIPGDGAPEADDVPAMLSSGEHVLDYEDVRRIGGGSNAKGHKELMEFRKELNSGPVPKGGALSALKKRVA